LDYNGVPDFNNPNQLYFTSGGQFSYYAPQFSSLYAWRSIAWSNYNAWQATLRHQMAHGFQFDLNHTFSKAIDISSHAERIGAASIGSLLGLNNNIINAWNPNAQKGVASFDATHQFNANWIYMLPFGKGQLVGRDSGRVLDALIGGWQFSGLFRLTSGFPVTVDNGFSNFPTNFELEGNADRVGPVRTGVFFNTGTPNIFANGPAAINSFAPAYAGESGQRNLFAALATSVSTWAWPSVGPCPGAKPKACNSAGKSSTSPIPFALTSNRVCSPASWVSAAAAVSATILAFSPTRASCSSPCATNLKAVGYG
jgi:hypothetical protein